MREFEQETCEIGQGLRQHLFVCGLFDALPQFDGFIDIVLHGDRIGKQQPVAGGRPCRGGPGISFQAG
jgi:hypothetical protein